VSVNRKVKAVFKAEMTPILAVGETLTEREDGATESKIGGQVRAGMRNLDADQAAALVIAYEPIWAIGTGRTADADTAGEVAAFIRAQVAEKFPDAAPQVRILYGGSVNPGNIAGFMAKKDVDGALVGGASLDPDQFAAVVRYWV
jgi:triosephosphate isomerase